MGRQFDMCEVCKLDREKLCNYDCIKRREDFAFRFFTCLNFIYDDNKPITNAELLSTYLKSDINLAATIICDDIAKNNDVLWVEDVVNWLKKETKLLE